MQNKPNFSNKTMGIKPFMTSLYEQRPLFLAPAKQTQSKPIKPNPASVFGPKIGFEHSKQAAKECNCMCFLRIFTKIYTLLEQIMFSFRPLSLSKNQQLNRNMQFGIFNTKI
ncbi:MAG: hypothetical protein ACYS9Y_07200 [Planctomycetota bacterium]|jgi:hypothetical protein